MNNEIEIWKNAELLTTEEKSQINQYSEAELIDAFAGELGFGTGGARGLIGIGPNRLNRFTVSKLTLGVAKWLLANSAGSRVVIAYDNRYMSKEFASLSAQILMAQGIEVFCFEILMPTPLLSFAVRYLEADAGIMITASHNPKEYNGYKLYNNFGAQLLPDEVESLLPFIETVGATLQEYQYAETTAQPVPEACVAAYIAQVERLLHPQYRDDYAKVSIGYSPQHGTGGSIVPRVFAECGFTNVTYVAEQMPSDEQFSATKSANPENPQAFEQLLEYGERLQLDVLLTTDPDADRLGAGVRYQGSYQLLSGNQLGALVVDYLLQHGVDDGTVVKTIVTSDFGAAVARKGGLVVHETLTGFKYIGAFAHQENPKQFVFGYEESFGYLLGDFVFDKDAVQMCAVVAEMAAFYKRQGFTLVDRLEQLYAEFGFYLEDLWNLQVSTARVQEIYQIFDALPAELLLANGIVMKNDYQTSRQYQLTEAREQVLTLPKAQVLKFYFSDGSWFCIRPSGTEPQIKLYFAVQGATNIESKKRLAELTDFATSVLNF
ncbi:phospho-sugar mutase [Culicoidibacter larvae]|uniref:Phosphoglucomutase n=1 Tax=Culicoidibacter larvae TaxID=2579976 RepID=A0A5R8QBD0_9FIRM|nr:phospho-sugar mutase [Culicoidibacter larvae]TLG72935.1 phospho-sugar mutase [Culicoidibacter larvae]